MFKELLDKSSVAENRMVIYRVLTKNAETVTSEDWTDLSLMVAEVAEMDNVNKQFLIEETAMSIYEMLASETGAPDMPNYLAVCSTVIGGLDDMLSQTELTVLVDCLETVRWMWKEGIKDLQDFCESFGRKIAQFAAGRYCIGMFTRRLLDIVIQVGNFHKMRNTIQALSETILSLNEESFEKSVVLNNEFMQF